MSNSRKWDQINRIVIKIGTSTLTNPNGELNFEHIKNLLREISYWHNQGKEIILVSSGAVAVGAHRMNFSQVPKTMPEKQALAAIGQGELINLYEEMFAEYQKVIAQVLLTRGDFDHRLSYLNATNALLAILNLNVIPIINENDTISTVEIKFGDNDTLSAMVAAMLNADMLIILSDVDGLYDCDPRVNKNAQLFTEITNITSEMENSSLNRGSSFSSGGMFTKLKAARICMSYGAHMIIANNAVENIISRLLNGETLGTLFIPRYEKMQARKKWIAFGRLAQGTIVVDAGAEAALANNGKSLLPSGIIKVIGAFDRGALVAVENAQGYEIARGITNYSSHETGLIAGCHSSDIEKILHEKDYDEVIHRNNLWVEKS
ncbi:MAG: glutamate 5-kinase [Syntrophomonadaceae bacterium]|jgi:glutamate 5-kinase|nr:glutamate 5-kinase [Syntrophomonadaceae bacterium]